MKRILKKNQLIIAALAVMIAAARISELFRKIITGIIRIRRRQAVTLRIKNFWIFLMKMLPVLPGISKARTAMKAK